MESIAFLLFPIYAFGYVIGFLFETFLLGFTRGRRELD
jgi:biotin transporter BioY